MKSNFLIAAPMSGSGKTTISRGLMALLARRGMRVQPFKCGPDYIDTKFHEAVCGCPSINLDSFMASQAHVRALFARYGSMADVCVVEGMMGLFDGYSRDLGSSADIARALGVPVVLVVDARSAAYSMAALLSGFVGFRPDVRICGVIFNKVGSERHYGMLTQVCDDLNIECFGYLPKNAALEQGSRYLGLDFSSASDMDSLVAEIEAHIDVDRILSVCRASDSSAPALPETTDDLRVLVARNDEAFSFMYHENIAKFKHAAFFNPETETPDFEGVDLLYLPGGYPEKHVEALAAATEARAAIRDYALRGGHVIAECGGMMFLCRQIITDEGSWPMCGVLPYTITARKADRKLSLGYRQFELYGHSFRGHEFHYTQFDGDSPTSVVQVYNAKGERVATPIIRYKNVVASYTHLYWGETGVRPLFESL